MSAEAAPRDRLRAGMRLGLLALLILSPLPFGGVLPGAVLLFEWSALALGAAALWIAARESDVLPASGKRLLWPAAFVLLLGGFQLLPLPGGVVQRLAPTVATARHAVATVLPEVVAGAAGPASLAPTETLDALLRFAAYACIALAAAVALRSETHLRHLALTLLAVAAFQALYGGFEFLSGRQHIFGYAKTAYLDEATGTFINRNHFAAYLAMALPFAIVLLLLPGRSRQRPTGIRRRIVRLAESDMRQRGLAAAAAFCLFAGILLSASRGGLAAGLIGAGVAAVGFGLRSRKRLALAAAVLALPTLFLLYQDVRAPGERFAELPETLGAEHGRPTVWLAGLEMVRDAPWLGTGLGTFDAAFPLYRPPSIRARWDHAHNDWLEAATGGGLPTLAAMALLLGWTLARPKALSRRRRHLPDAVALAAAGGLLAVACHSLVDFPLRIPAVALLAAVLVGTKLAADRLALERQVDELPARS